MKKNSKIPALIIIILSGTLFIYQQGYLDRVIPNENDTPSIPDEKTIKIAAFNIQIFGRTKREKTEVMNILAEIAHEFDVMLVQEFRDSSETTAPFYLETINALEGPDYEFIRSSRLGRSTSKEAYAYYYNTDTVQYQENSAYVYDDINDVFEREPYIASFRSGNFDFTLVGIHTKPDDAENEIGNLTIVVSSILENVPSEHDIIVLGDFNADGSYFNEESMENPLKSSKYFWTVSNNMDTMTKTGWTYDRIVMMTKTYSIEYVQDSTQVYYFDTVMGLNQTQTMKVSDHYPVYAEFQITLPDDD